MWYMLYDHQRHSHMRYMLYGHQRHWLLLGRLHNFRCTVKVSHTHGDCGNACVHCFGCYKASTVATPIQSVNRNVSMSFKPLAAWMHVRKRWWRLFVISAKPQRPNRQQAALPCQQDVGVMCVLRLAADNQCNLFLVFSHPTWCCYVRSSSA